MIIKNFKIFHILVCITLCSCAFCPDLCHGSKNTVKPSEYEDVLKTSVKRYLVYTYKKDKILCEPYRVSKDDWLYKIFRKKGEISEKDFPLFINIFKAINPSVNNIDAIHQGQRILIPLKKIHKNDFKETRPGIVDVPVIELTHIPDVLKPFIEKHRIKKGEVVSKLLNAIFLNRDGTLNTQGMRAFKLANPNIKNVNLIYAGSFINLPSASLCLQPWFKSSLPVKAAVKTKDRDKIKKIKKTGQEGRGASKQENITRNRYSLYTVLRDYAHMIGGKPLQTGKFYFPRNNNADFILDLKSTPVIELASGRKILIVPDKKTGAALSGIIKLFWKDLKVMTIASAAQNLIKHNPKLTDKKLRDHLESNTRVSRNKLLNTRAGDNYLPVNHESAVKKLLGFTDFHYIPDYKISLSIHDVNFNVFLGRIHKKDRPDLLVDFGTIYGYAFDLLRNKGFKIISFSPKSTFKTQVVKLFADLGMLVTKNPVFISTRTKKAITIHGLYVTGNIQDMLISDQPLDKETTAFLNQKKIKSLYFK